MLIKEEGGGTFENPKPDTYVATCRQIIDLGTQDSDYQGVKSSKHQVLVGWELDELMEDGRPFVVSKFYTASLNEKSNFRHDLASWRGRDFTADELAGFDPSAILGKSCQLGIILNEKGKTKVGTVTKLHKSMSAPPLVNPIVYFSFMKFDQAVFDGLSQGIKDIIMKSPEWANQHGRTIAPKPVSVTPEADFDDGFEDDIPF